MVTNARVIFPSVYSSILVEIFEARNIGSPIRIRN